jgi:methionine-rich copper-binding protein CopC
MRFLILLSALLVFSSPSFACPVLHKAEPRVGSEIATAPDAVRIYFSQPVLPDESNLQVLNSSGQVVSHGKAYGENDDKIVAVKLGPLPPGKYKVVWKVRCNCEDDEMTLIPGDYKFTVVKKD